MDQTGSQVFVVPVKELHQFKLSWLLPWQVAKWKSTPTAYVKYLLEQEGDGSLLAALAAAGLSQNHAVNCFDYHGVASTLELSVDLVNTTEETLMRVGTLAFAYISLIRSKEVQQELWQKSGNCMSCSFTTQMNWGVQRLLLRSILCKTLHVICTTIRLNKCLQRIN